MLLHCASACLAQHLSRLSICCRPNVYFVHSIFVDFSFLVLVFAGATSPPFRHGGSFIASDTSLWDPPYARIHIPLHLIFALLLKFWIAQLVNRLYVAFILPPSAFTYFF